MYCVRLLEKQHCTLPLPPLFAFLLPILALVCSPKVPHPGLLKLSLSTSLKEKDVFSG